METGRAIRIMGLAGVPLVLGALGSWWLLQADIRDIETANMRLRTENQQLKQGNTLLQASLAELGKRVTTLEHAKTTLEAGIRDTEAANMRLHSENQQLRRNRSSLQASVVALKDRIVALESIKTTLEGTVDNMRKKLHALIAKRDHRRVVSKKNRPVPHHVTVRKNQNKPENDLPGAKAGPQKQATIRSLANDDLALLLVTFLVKYEPGWFHAPRIQSMAGEQEVFDLFRYHSWTAIDAKLRSMERAGVVKGRDHDDPRIGRQFTIRHGAPLTMFQTLSSR